MSKGLCVLGSAVCILLIWTSGPIMAQDQPQPTGWSNPSAAAQPDPSALIQNAPSSPEPAPNGALAAMTAIDPKYTEGILVVTARDGTPVPKEWIVVARDADEQGTLHKITVADGQVIADVQSMNAFEAFRQDVNIEISQVQTDSGDAFMTAQSVAGANLQIIGRVDYALTIRGKDAAPIWTLNCFDMNGVFIGKVVLLATTGAILETPGFKNSPNLN